jgi:hypothetical protein
MPTGPTGLRPLHPTIAAMLKTVLAALCFCFIGCEPTEEDLLRYHEEGDLDGIERYVRDGLDEYSRLGVGEQLDSSERGRLALAIALLATDSRDGLELAQAALERVGDPELSALILRCLDEHEVAPLSPARVVLAHEEAVVVPRDSIHVTSPAGSWMEAVAAAFGAAPRSEWSMLLNIAAARLEAGDDFRGARLLSVYRALGGPEGEAIGRYEEKAWGLYDKANGMRRHDQDLERARRNVEELRRSYERQEERMRDVEVRRLFVVSRIGALPDGEAAYEVVPPEPFDPFLPSLSRMVLLAREKTFESRGWTFIAVREDGSVPIPMRDDLGSFVQDWPVLEEVPVSELTAFQEQGVVVEKVEAQLVAIERQVHENVGMIQELRLEIVRELREICATWTHPY